MIGLDFDQKGIESLKSKYSSSSASSASSASSGKHLFFTVDVTKGQGVQEVYEAVVAAGISRVDAVVNLAGVINVGPLVEMAERDFTTTVSIALFGTFLTTKTFFPLLVASGRGRVINTSSEVSHTCYQPFNIPYQLSKVAIEGYSRGLQAEVRRLGMKVVVISPGPVLTPLLNLVGDKFGKARDSSRYFKSDLGHLASSSPYYAATFGVSSEAVAEVYFQAIHASYPRYQYLVNNSVGFWVLGFIPAPFAQMIQMAATPLVARLISSIKSKTS